jgi:hypothetical protein
MSKSKKHMETLQQVLDNGSTLDKNAYIEGAGFDFNAEGFGDYNIYAQKGTAHIVEDVSNKSEVVQWSDRLWLTVADKNSGDKVSVEISPTYFRVYKNGVVKNLLDLLFAP